VSVVSGIVFVQEKLRMLTSSDEPTIVGSESIFYFLYILIGLPLIGVLFLLFAIRFKDIFNSRMEN
jgi:hypothetical protein